MVYNLLQDYSHLRMDSRAQVNLSPVLDKTKDKDNLVRVNLDLVRMVSKDKVKDKVSLVNQDKVDSLANLVKDKDRARLVILEKEVLMITIADTRTA